MTLRAEVAQAERFDHGVGPRNNRDAMLAFSPVIHVGLAKSTAMMAFPPCFDGRN